MNFVLHPEYYKINPTDNNNIVKGLYISCNTLVVPHITTDTPEKLLESIFKQDKPQPVLFKEQFHMYISPLEQYMGKHVNHIATSFVRLHSIQSYGFLKGQRIFGNVILFGTMNLQKNEYDAKDHSIPYKIVEEAFRIYDSTQCYKTFVHKKTKM